MSNTEGTSVMYACLQGTIFIPGVGQKGPTLTADLTGKDLKMTQFDNFLVVETKGVKVRISNAMVSHTIVSRTLNVV